MKIIRINTCLCLLLILSLLSGCKKFLDENPQPSDRDPKTLDDLQSLLNSADAAMNSKSAAGFAELIADNYYVPDWVYNLFLASDDPANRLQAPLYVWDSTAIPIAEAWDQSYRGPIHYSNIVLDYINHVESSPGDEVKYNSIKGQALFYRAFTFHSLAQVFCRPYSPVYANDPGIVLRISSNVTSSFGRATVQETYDRIIKDLTAAVDFLPLTTTIPTQPNKAAAYAALARVYLSMNKYSNARDNASLALDMQPTLMDYNAYLPVRSPPMKRFNPEVIFHHFDATPLMLSDALAVIDPLLYSSYAADDLRKTIFFRGDANSPSFRGSYDGDETAKTYGIFDGLATDELYLIRAECNARLGEINDAREDLNKLMQNRWRHSSWTPVTTSDSSELLTCILQERQKELLYRGLRWSDVRRFNADGAQITLRRKIAGNSFILPPNHPRTVMLIPQQEINLSGIPQNPR